ncbi:Hypothetical protein A7982_05490 [Minicystis rosea]|nr:Hypothetical protein A7982_05490 [Minicystis rosea]
MPLETRAGVLAGARLPFSSLLSMPRTHLRVRPRPPRVIGNLPDTQSSIST